MQIQLNPGDLFSNHTLAHDLGEFMLKAYAMGLNPLPGIRRTLSDFSWEVFEPGRNFFWGDIFEEIKNADIVCALPTGDVCGNRSATSYLVGKFKKGEWPYRSYWEAGSRFLLSGVCTEEFGLAHSIRWHHLEMAGFVSGWLGESELTKFA